MKTFLLFFGFILLLNLPFTARAADPVFSLEILNKCNSNVQVYLWGRECKSATTVQSIAQNEKKTIPNLDSECTYTLFSDAKTVLGTLNGKAGSLTPIMLTTQGSSCVCTLGCL